MEFIVTGHPAVVDRVTGQYRRVYQALGLFSPSQCRSDSFERLDYEGKVLVLSPGVLKESYWNERAMPRYAHDSFECSPHAIGRSIRYTYLGSGEVTRWNRADLIGILKDESLPGWAAEKLAELKDIDQTQSEYSAVDGTTTRRGVKRK